MALPELKLEDIRCSYCGYHCQYKDNFSEACCQRCNKRNVDEARDIRAHEQSLADQDYFGYPEMVTIPSISKISIGDVVKQRGNEFIAV